MRRVKQEIKDLKTKVSYTQGALTEVINRITNFDFGKYASLHKADIEFNELLSTRRNYEAKIYSLNRQIENLEKGIGRLGTINSAKAPSNFDF